MVSSSIFICSAWRLLAFDPFSRALRWAAVGYAAVGVGFSIYFTILQVAFIHAFCIYCLGSAVTTVLLLMAAFAHFRASPPGIIQATG